MSNNEVFETSEMFGLIDDVEMNWNVKEEKVTAVNNGVTYVALAWVAATC